MDVSGWEKAGVIGVDAGLCWIGDPCYCVTPDANEHPAKTWDEFCDKLGSKDVKQWDYARGHPGLGVSMQSGYGDGPYNVYIRRNREGRIAAAMVVFDGDEQDDE